MKYLLLFFIIVTLGFTACDKTGDTGDPETVVEETAVAENIPDEVVGNFNERFTTAENPQWEEAAPDTFAVDYEMRSGHLKYRSIFTRNGSWVETSYIINPDKLPNIVNTAIKTKYPNHRVTQATHIDSNQFGTVYGVILKEIDSENTVQVLFDQEGIVVNEIYL